ncbi:MAG TPA: MarR family winged helix-turn-helix transcriptional regulator [Jatrophihabitans sp.]|nr:MarR family winged helix-turn-helix transcriptional regulator [Jatrophihabitans sp.]
MNPGGPPAQEPIGLAVTRTARLVERAFDDALTAAGGSRPTWLILLAIISGAGTTQAALAERVGIAGPTLVHHLDRLEAAGLVTRRSDPSNRRIRSLALTDAGRETFTRLRGAAAGFDTRLRAGLSGADIETLRRCLDVLRANTAPSDHHPPSTEEVS